MTEYHEAIHRPTGAEPPAEEVLLGGPLEWHKVKDCWVAMRGQQAVCIIEKVEGAPIELWAPHILRDCFTTTEDAKVQGLKNLALVDQAMAPPIPRKSEKEWYLEILKQVVSALEVKTANQNQSEAEVLAGGNK